MHKKKNEQIDGESKKDGVQIIVRSKSLARGFCLDVPWAGIQIATHDGDWPELGKCQQIDSLRMHFYDCDLPREGWKLFDESHADTIIDFVEKVWDKIDVLMVHCEAGVSRSPAIAAAISKIKFNDDKKFFEHYVPNRLVYNVLLKRYYEKQKTA